MSNSPENSNNMLDPVNAISALNFISKTPEELKTDEQDISSFEIESEKLLQEARMVQERFKNLYETISKFDQTEIPGFLQSISDILVPSMQEKKQPFPKNDVTNFLYTEVLLRNIVLDNISIISGHISALSISDAVMGVKEKEMSLPHLFSSLGRIALRAEILERRLDSVKSMDTTQRG